MWFITTEEGRQFLLGGILCVAGALFLIRYIFLTRRRSRESNSWPSVAGKILESKTEEFRRKGASNFVPWIEYEYNVQGTDYKSRRIGLVSITGSNKSAADEIVSKYPESSEVNVYYDPNKHSYSILEKGPVDSRNYNFMWLLVILLMIIGVVNILVTWEEIINKF